MQSSVYFGGSRHLESSPLIWQVVQTVINQGYTVHVGCQYGADASVIHAALLAEHGKPSLVVLAVAQSVAQAPDHVRFAYHCKAKIVFGAGGDAHIKARYLLRSIAAFRGCEAAVFFAPGRGSLAVARECIKSGLPVFAFGVLPAGIPSQSGQWVESAFVGFSCWQWQATAEQSNLF